MPLARHEGNRPSMYEGANIPAKGFALESLPEDFPRVSGRWCQYRGFDYRLNTETAHSFWSRQDRRATAENIGQLEVSEVISALDCFLELGDLGSMDINTLSAHADALYGQPMNSRQLAVLARFKEKRKTARRIVTQALKNDRKSA